jgi:hypothetical protein
MATLMTNLKATLMTSLEGHANLPLIATLTYHYDVCSAR